MLLQGLFRELLITEHEVRLVSQSQTLTRKTGKSGFTHVKVSAAAKWCNIIDVYNTSTDFHTVFSLQLPKTLCLYMKWFSSHFAHTHTHTHTHTHAHTHTHSHTLARTHTHTPTHAHKCTHTHTHTHTHSHTHTHTYTHTQTHTHTHHTVT